MSDERRFEYLATLRVFNRFKSLYGVFLSDNVAHVCKELGVALPILHTLPLFHVLSNRLQIENGYMGFESHQDWSGLQSSLNTVVVWLPLHDVDKDRFPLEVLPKSHADGVKKVRAIATSSPTSSAPLHAD